MLVISISELVSNVGEHIILVRLGVVKFYLLDLLKPKEIVLSGEAIFERLSSNKQNLFDDIILLNDNMTRRKEIFIGIYKITQRLTIISLKQMSLSCKIKQK